MKIIERILVVDDDPDISSLLQSKLAKLGFQVQVHPRATNAVQAAKDFNAQLVLLDVMLGDGIGYQVARSLRSDRLLYRIAVLFQSVIEDQHEVDHAYSEGGDGYLTKPYNFDELKKGITQMGRLLAETDRRCIDTKFQSLTHLRREVDHRLFRQEPIALFYVHFEHVAIENGAAEPRAVNSKGDSILLAAAIRRALNNGGFYETESCHMGGGYFMIMTQIDDRERFHACLQSEIAEFTRRTESNGTSTEIPGVLVTHTHTDESNFGHASEMFDELKEPRATKKKKKKQPNTSKVYWTD